MFRKSLVVIAAFVAFTFALRTAEHRSAAQALSQVDPSFFQGLRYRLVGPSRGGRVTTVTGVPSQPKTFYMSYPPS